MCLVTSGPAATNSVTGARRTRTWIRSPSSPSPARCPTHLIGNDAFQEADIVGITRPCTKYNYLVKDVKELAPDRPEAFYIATTGRPGPVLIDLPEGRPREGGRALLARAASTCASYKPTYDGHPVQVAARAS